MSRKKSNYDFVISYYVDSECKVIAYSNRIYHSFNATYNNLYRYRHIYGLDIYKDGEIFEQFVGSEEIKRFLELVVNGL